MKPHNTRLGIILMCATAFVFSLQDVLSRHLAGTYNVYMIVMLRFWVFGVFVAVIAGRQPGGLRAAAFTRQPALQLLRGVLLPAEICVMVVSFVSVGLIASHAVFASYPLIIAALSGPVLGEKVGWRRWTAIAIGFVGILIILEPGVTVFTPLSVIALVASAMFALYGLLTRYAARQDSATVSFFWTGMAGAITMTPVGLWHWQSMSGTDWALMGLLGCLASLSHFLMIKALEVAEASAIQPFAYLQLVFVSFLGIEVYGETLRANLVIGGAVVVSAGLFTLWRSRVVGSHTIEQTLTDPSARP